MILGKHTIAEVNDLIATTEYRVQANNVALRALTADQLAKDSTLQSDWEKFLARWVDARGSARLNIAKERAAFITIAGLVASDDAIPDEGDWTALLHATSAIYPSYGPTDLPGLQQRIVAVGGTPQLGNQPGLKASDIDLKAYNAADTTIQVSKEAATTVSKGIGQVLWENKGKVAIGLGILFGAAVIYKKV